MGTVKEMHCGGVSLFFEIGSHYIGQAGLELRILPHSSPNAAVLGMYHTIPREE
jgi:hypothetical protein